MASFFEEKSMALNYIRRLQAELTDDRQIYDQFSETLKQFGRGNIHTSTAVATLQKLLHNHPDLRRAFKPFVPRTHSAAPAPPNDSALKASLDFIKRVGTRFAGHGVYRKFLDCMKSHSSGEITVSEACDEVFRLSGNHPDLAADFRSFLPESYIQQSREKKRRVESLQPPTKKRSCPDSRRKPERSISNNQTIDFVMEDSLCEIDVQIGNVTATYNNAVKLMRLLSDGRLSTADVRLDEHFTPLNLACIRGICRKLLDKGENPVYAISDLINKLTKKKEALNKSRVRIVEKWNNIRQSTNNF